MKEIITAWLIRSILIPFAFWLDDEGHTMSMKTLKESEEAKREGITLHQYRVKHRVFK